MGMFDSLFMDCPACGAERALEFQSKSGPCQLEEYTIENVPAEVLMGLHRDIEGKCPNCGKSFLPRAREQKVVTLHTVVLIECGPLSPDDDRYR